MDVARKLARRDSGRVHAVQPGGAAGETCFSKTRKEKERP
jgi:hypothetical protein